MPEIEAKVVGADNIIDFTASRFEAVTAVHHGHTPMIEILSADSATGLWAMEDRLQWAEGTTGPAGYTHIHGFGHYHETYRRTGAGWRIASSRLTRLQVERR